jgi:hypothetical protein
VVAVDGADAVERSAARYLKWIGAPGSHSSPNPSDH